MCALYEPDLNMNTPTFLPTGSEEAEETNAAGQNQFQLKNQRAGIYTPSREEDARQIHRRRRWTHEEKKSIVAETELPGHSISGVARKYGIAPRLLFSWRRQLSEEMPLTTKSGAKIVPVSMVRDLERKVHELEDVIQMKTEEIGQLQKALATCKAANG